MPKEEFTLCGSHSPRFKQTAPLKAGQGNGVSMGRRTLIMVILTVVSVAVLAVLFVLTGNRDGKPSDEVRDKAGIDTENSECFQFEPETLTYDGTGDLDLLCGVTFTDLSDSDAVGEKSESGSESSVAKRGQELRDIVFVRISAGNALYRKNIIYTAQLSNGETASAVRPLWLEGYSRPTITMPDDEKLPQLTRETMDSIQNEVMETKGFTADDGFGNDARDHIEVFYETDRLDSSLIHYTYELTNLFNDKAYTSLDMALPSGEARIILSVPSVTITQEEPFNAMDFIVRAVNSDGSDGRYNIKISGKVDQSNPGSNTISFDLEDAHLELTVNVVKSS